MGILCEVSQTCTEIIKVDVAVLKSMSYDSVITGLHKFRDIHLSVGEESGFRLPELSNKKLAFLRQICAGNPRQMLNIPDYFGLTFDIHQDLCSWLIAVLWQMRLSWQLHDFTKQCLKRQSLRRGDVLAGRVYSNLLYLKKLLKVMYDNFYNTFDLF